MSRQKISLLTLSFLATNALSAHTALGYSGAQAAAGAAMRGLLVDDSIVGQQAPYDVLGTSIAIAGGTIADGAQVEVGTGGQLITHASGIVVGRAMQAAVVNDRFEVLLVPS